MFLLLPSFMIALSGRYQQEVNRPGLGYLPVYFAYFGMALLISEGLISWIRKGADRLVRMRMAALLAAVVAVFSFNGNRIAAREMNRQRMGHRLLIQDGMQAGLFAEVPKDAVIVHEEDSGWMIPECVYQYAGKSLSLVYHDPKRPTDVRTNPLPEHAYHLRAQESEDGSGRVSLTPPGGGEPRVFQR